MVLCTLYTVLGYSQNFPVQVIPQAIPPAPIHFSDYADASTVSSPLRVQIILNDLEIANREVRLKVHFQGNGITFQSNDIVVGADPLFLEGGVPLILTNVELTPYFQFQNITGISPNVYGQAIPEGAYQFCFEVYDVLSGNRLSNKSCATTVVFQNEPPFLVMPRDKTNIEEINPQSIVFQWTPRSINVTNVEYELSLVEIWDTQIDPQAAFLSSPPVFQTTTTATTYVYGPADPLLLSGKNYAWRVQARAKQGIEEIGLFKNEGYSEIFSFSYAGSCDLPLSLNHEVKGSTNANIFWDDFTTDIPEYTVRYRKKGNDNEWFLSKTTTNQLTLWDLKAGTTYEYQIQKKCTVTGSDWSLTKEFTTSLEFEEESVIDCGVSPDINLTNMEPLASISSGASFKAGDFPVKITEVSGSNGRFTGKGYVSLPYLKNIKVAVEFTNILINTDQEMAEGTVNTVYDPTWKNMLSVDSVLDVAEDITDEFTGGDENVTYSTSFEIPSEENITVEDGKIVVTGPNGETTTFDYDEGDSYEISDANGNTFNIDKEGNITTGEKGAEGGASTAESTDGISGGSGTAADPSVSSISATGITVHFEASINTKYGIDKVDEDSAYEKANYPKATTTDGSMYYPIHKAVVEGKTDEFLAIVENNNPEIDLDSLQFKTVKGTQIKSARNGNTFTITVTGSNSYHSDEAIVTYKGKDGKYKIIASFFIHHIKQHEVIDVVLVAVNGSSPIPDLEKQLNEIYGKAGATFKVTTKALVLDQNDWDDNGNKILDYDGSGLMSDYPQELKNIQQKYKDDNKDWNRSAYHLFLLPTDIPLGKALSGFMPKTRQWGYVFGAHTADALEDKSSQSLVAAHELGHGVFALPHPFQNDENKSGSGTDWLMDYGGGDQLSYTNWAAMSDESLQLFIFQDEEDGEFRTYEFYAGKNVLSGKFSAYGKKEESYSFLTKTGKIISLPNDIEDVTFDDDGLLLAFNVLENNIKERYVSSKYKNSGDFAGFRKNFENEESENKDNIYKDYISKSINGKRTNVYLGLPSLCDIWLYESTFLVEVSGNWNSGGDQQAIKSINTIALGLIPINGGQLVLSPPPLNNKIDLINHYESPSSCSDCENGKEFFETYAPTTANDKERESLLRVSNLICKKGEEYYNALVSQLSKNNQAKKDALFYNEHRYLYDLGQELFWNEVENPWERYANALIEINNLFKSQTDIFARTNPDDLFFLLNYCTLSMLKQINLDYKVTILGDILRNETFITDGTWLSFFSETKDEEGLIIKLLSTIESEEAVEFLEKIKTYHAGEEKIIVKLIEQIDDNLGRNHYTTLNQILLGLIIESEGGIESYLAKYANNSKVYPWLHERDFWIFINTDIKYSHSLGDDGSLTFSAKYIFQNEFRLTDEDEEGEEIRNRVINCLTNDCSSKGIIDYMENNKAKKYTFLNFVKETTIEDPYQVILIEFGSDVDLDGNPNTAEITAGSILPIPAFFFKYVLIKNDWTILKRDANDATTIVTSALAVGSLIKGAQALERGIIYIGLFYTTTDNLILTDSVRDYLNSSKAGKLFLSTYTMSKIVYELSGTFKSENKKDLIINLISNYFTMDGVYYDELGAPFSEKFPTEFRNILNQLEVLKSK